MAVRVHTLAKQLGLSSPDLIKRLKGLKINVKTHMSSLDDETAEILKHEIEDVLKKKAQPPKVQAKVGKAKKPSLSQKELKPEKVEPLQKQPEAPKVEGSTEEVVQDIVLQPLNVTLPLTVKEFSSVMGVKVSDLIKEMMDLGVFATINQVLNEAAVREIAQKHGFEIKVHSPAAEGPDGEELAEGRDEASKAGFVQKAPVVTFMGHVDHGKTSLLDYIRKARVAEKETGGITQHIGAYEVELDKGAVTFLDTPGHEAFTAMRARGASATDIVVLVVAADDGIMPQTIEAINHSRAANVPIVVAINKCDLPSADIDKVMGQLAKQDLLSEEMGGKTIAVRVSAKTGEGVDKLLEMLLLEAEVLELKANPSMRCRGIIIEGRRTPGQGIVATVLVKNGTLKNGDIVMTNLYYGKVKAMINDRGERVSEALPSKAVEILGLSGVPEAGEKFYVVKDERQARTLSLLKQSEERASALRGQKHITLEELYDSIKGGDVKDLKIVLKGDVQGSVEALEKSLTDLATKEVQLVIIHKGVGNINEADVMLAAASNAVIIGFHVRKDAKAQEMAFKEKVDLRVYNVIYEAIADVSAAMEGLLEPIEKEVFLGRAEVRQVFQVTKSGTIAGCFIKKGTIPRNATIVRLVRGGRVAFQGKISSLKRFKDDARQVEEGYECGISLGKHNDIKAGDLIEAYSIEMIARRLKK
ncbi:MAG: translation initiation factor IF-2 [Candidatus Omnitrophica bacterium]|nr:translation initiation factor IF-2 [Candidatus Omnitrophota bacterium]